MHSKRIILYCLLICFLIPTLTDARIVFKSYRDGSRSLYVMDDDGRNVQKLTDRDGSWPSWSPDGKRIVFSAEPPGVPNWPQQRAIYIINSDGTGEHRLTNEETLEGNPTWSPDGQYIAFHSDRLAKPGTAQTDIWTIHIATKRLRRLTHTEKLTVSPSWSPDGKYIAYREGGEIHLIRPNGSGHHELWPKNENYKRYFPRWSVDSQSVLYMEDRYNAVGEFISEHVVIHDIKSDKRQVVNTPDKWLIHSACFMGREYLLIGVRDFRGLNKENAQAEKYDIYRYHLGTGEIVDLTRTPENDFAMDWIDDDVLPVSPQGKKTVTWGTVKQQDSE